MSDYIVQKGDSLWKIARKQGVTYAELLNINPQLTKHGRNPNLLYPGEKINLPDQTKFSQNQNIPQATQGCSNRCCLRTRPSLEQILKDYQVQEVQMDQMIQWRPSWSGVIPIPFVEPPRQRITEIEGRLLDRLSSDRGMVGLIVFKNIYDQAFEISRSQFQYPPTTEIITREKQEWINNDGQRDAFRHAYWNALLTAQFGEEWTTQFTTAHEAVPGNPAAREAMDLYNNEVGRRIAICHPDATEEQLANLVAQAVNNGELVVIDENGALAWSNQVPLWKHGVTPKTPGVGGRPIPNGDAEPIPAPLPPDALPWI